MNLSLRFEYTFITCFQSAKVIIGSLWKNPNREFRLEYNLGINNNCTSD